MAADPAQTAGAPTLAQVKAHWREMMDRVGEVHKNLPPLLNMSKPLAVEGQTIVLGFDYPIFKEKFNNLGNAANIIGEAFSDLLGSKCSVRSVVVSEYDVAISEDEFSALAEELGGVVRRE